MKLPCVGRHARRAVAAALQAGAIDQRSGGRGNAVGDPIDGRVRVLENAAGARGFERLRPFPVRERVARDGAQRGRLPASDAKISRQHQLARALQAAPVVAELHVGRGNANLVPVPRSTTSTLSTSSEIRRPLKWALP